MTAANGNCAASVTWLTGVTFAALTAPLAMFGAQPLDVSLGKVTIRGPLDHYAMEYLGAAAAISVGLGASRLIGKKASRDSQQARVDSGSASAMLSTSMADSLVAPTNSSLLTEASLKASGLHLFLDEDEVPMALHLASWGEAQQEVNASNSGQSPILPGSFEVQPQGAAQGVNHAAPMGAHGTQPLPTPDALASMVAEVQSIVQQMSAQSQEGNAVQADGTEGIAVAQTAEAALAPTPVPSASRAAVRVGALPLASHHTAPIFPAAQSYVSFARIQEMAEQPAARDLGAELAVLEQIYQIREQMQHLMNQVDLIQAELEQTLHPAQRLVPLRAAQVPSYTVSEMEPLRAVAAPVSEAWVNYRATA